ncbi:MAG: hypothetical protein A2W99_10870 [Bacteroidetes bacterium GWF2_33_16]|nr:MAG: hypothetical protein A2X00_04870 [Bacteroidetes bacterium GWE2_32_14]OFY04041.1 MAG: hypothetical protein A2W99_10870 [Bacteroidetes bacterium GWF2_33_16]
MFKNYFILSLRYISKNFLFVGINILGLAIALALCITAYLNTKYDSDWDKTHANYNQIYKINITRDMQSREQEYGITPFALAQLIKQDISGIDQVCRYITSFSPIKYDDKIFSKRIGYADPNYFEVFSVDMVKGSKDAIRDKGKILINENLASIYFGNEDPIGKVITIFNDQGQETAFIVGGIFKTLPLNTIFFHEAITQIDNYRDMWQIDDQKWDNWVAATFLLVKDQNKISQINELLSKFIPVQNDARQDWKITRFFTKSLKDVAEDREVWAMWLRPSFHPAAVIAPPIMAIFILIIAAFNFMNSAISFAGKRLKEIGLRKVFGGLRRHIIIQFISENLIISLIAVILGVAFAGFLVPAYSSMWEYMDLVMDFKQTPSLIVFVFLLWIVTALLAGAYPAFYVSRFNPVKIFREKLKLSGRNALSKILLVVQFSISVMAIVSGVIFTQNAIFQDEAEFGYDKDNIIILSVNNKNDYKPFEQVIRSNPKIEMYAGTSYHIGYGNYNRSIKYLDQQVETNIMHIGYDYLKTMGVKVLQGRNFGLENQSADIEGQSVIVNEKFVNDFGLEEPVGKTVYMNDTLALQIIGVSKDIYLYGFWAPVEPLIFRLDPEDEYRQIAVRASKENLNDINEYLKKEWAAIIPNYPYNGRFQVELLNEAKQINKNIKIMFVFLAICALLSSVIGLYTLVSLSILNRTKEIGIRKVMGAGIGNISQNISKPFIIILGIAALIGCGLGYYSSDMLMASIWKEYVSANAYSFIIPIIILFISALLTISWRIYKAAIQNPVNSLRYE